MAKFESICTINIDAALAELEYLLPFITDIVEGKEEIDDSFVLGSYFDTMKKGWIGLGNGGYMKRRAERT